MVLNFIWNQAVEYTQAMLRLTDTRTQGNVGLVLPYSVLWVLWTPRTDLVQWGAETGGCDPLVSPDSNLVLYEDTPFGEVQIPQDRWLLPCPAFCQPA